MSNPPQLPVEAIDNKAQLLSTSGEDEAGRDGKAIYVAKTHRSRLSESVTVSNLRKCSLFVAGLVSGCLISVCLLWSPSLHRNRLLVHSFGREWFEPPPVCSLPSAFSTLDVKENLFIPLTITEAISIRKWLMRPELGLNLTRADEATLK